MNSKETLNKVKTLLGLEVKLEERKLENGTRFEAQAFESGEEIFIVTDEDQRIPVPQGEYILDDGMVVVVAEDGLIAEVKQAEEEVVEETVEAPVVEEVEAAIEDEMRDMMGRIQNLEDAIADLKADKVEASVETELSEESKPLKHNPENKGEIKQNLFAQNKPMSTQDRVFAKLFNN